MESASRYGAAAASASRSVTFVDTLLTFWPPLPEERECVTSTMCCGSDGGCCGGSFGGGGVGGTGGSGAAASGGGGQGDKATADVTMSLAQLPEGQLGELIIYRSGRVALQIGEHKLEVGPGTVNSCDQEIVSMGVAGSPGAPVDIHRLGKMHERLVVTPNVDSLLASL